MYNIIMVYDIPILIALIFLSGYFSAAETSFTSLTLLQVQEIKKRQPKKGHIIENARKQPENFLTTVLIASTLVNILASVIVTRLTLDLFGDRFLGYSTGIITLLILVFGEVTPKRLAISHSVFICVHTIRVIIALCWVMRPAVYFIGAISLFFTRLFGATPGQKITLQGVIHLVNLAHEHGVLEDDTSQMMKSIIHFDEIKVQAIMTHRTRVFSLPATMTVEEAMGRVLQEDYSRIPVYEENLENITGVVLAKDIGKAAYGQRGKDTLGSLAKNPVFVSAQTSVYRLLSTLRESKVNLVVVLDEYGGLAGIVTNEDIIGEVIGQVHNEDEAAGKIGPQPDGSWRILGGTPLQMINDSLGTNFTATKTSQTLGGFLFDLAGCIPPEGQQIATDEGIFIVEKITRGRIVLVRYLAKRSETA